MQQNYGEKNAEKYLCKLGYCVLKRNYRVHMVGEIDLVCLDGDELVFVEVRERGSLDFGGPEGSINFKKLLRIIKTAQVYLSKKTIHSNWRIDVIAIYKGHIEHLKGVTSN